MTGKARARLSFVLGAPLRDAVAQAADVAPAELREAERLLSLFSSHVLAQTPAEAGGGRAR